MIHSLTSARTAVLLFLAAAIGCSSASSDNAKLSDASAVSGRDYLLQEEPDGAVGVIAARESAEDGAPVVVVGRIGGSANPWIDGRAAFTLLDASMTVVGEGEDSAEGELCTGDCCATERLACTTLVKVVDGDGQIVPVDTRKLLGVKEADMIVVKGMAKKDKSGNLTLLANRVYVRN